MKKIQQCLTIASACIFAGVPNVFKPKTPASAAEVNANFSYLDSMISTKSDRSKTFIRDSIRSIVVSNDNAATWIFPSKIILYPPSSVNAQEYSIHAPSDGSLHLSGYNNDDFSGDIFQIDPLNFKVYRQIIALSDDSVSGSLRVGGASRFNSDLRVNGTLYANIQSAKIPDFVFSPQYELMPLAKVEEFTQQFQHLPGIPSANEMEKEQVDLVRMNMLLLQKIEELTLHVIRQQKEIDALKISR